MHWALDNISKIARLLGIPIKKDKYTKEKAMLRCVMIVIEMRLEELFPKFIEFVNDWDILVRKKSQHRQEWRRMDRNE